MLLLNFPFNVHFIASCKTIHHLHLPPVSAVINDSKWEPFPIF